MENVRNMENKGSNEKGCHSLKNKTLKYKIG
jgi:hypothetical protein